MVFGVFLPFSKFPWSLKQFHKQFSKHGKTKRSVNLDLAGRILHWALSLNLHRILTSVFCKTAFLVPCQSCCWILLKQQSKEVGKYQHSYKLVVRSCSTAAKSQFTGSSSSQDWMLGRRGCHCYEDGEMAKEAPMYLELNVKFLYWQTKWCVGPASSSWQWLKAST